MQISPELEQFLKDNKIVITDEKFNNICEEYRRPFDKITYNHEYIVYRHVYSKFYGHCDETEKFTQFLFNMHTAESIFMIGDIHYLNANDDTSATAIHHLTQASVYYKLSYHMGSLDACYWAANCYFKIFTNKDNPQFLKFAHLSADIHGDARSCKLLGNSYHVQGKLKKARRYFKLSIDAGCNTEYCVSELAKIELKLLKKFDIALAKDDYMLAYELGSNKLKKLQQKIEMEYVEVIGLPRDLSNIVVSYLL